MGTILLLCIFIITFCELGKSIMHAKKNKSIKTIILITKDIKKK